MGLQDLSLADLFALLIEVRRVKEIFKNETLIFNTHRETQYEIHEEIDFRLKKLGLPTIYK